MNATVETAPGVIEPLRREDRDPLHKLLVETGNFTGEEIAIALELIDAVLDKPDQQDYLIRTYRDHGRVLGYYCIGPTPATQGTYDLYWIAVDPATQGRGVGKALITHAEELIVSRKGYLVVAETSSQPRYEKTRRFYIGTGYREVARISGYYRPDDDLVMYGKYLSQP